MRASMNDSSAPSFRSVRVFLFFELLLFCCGFVVGTPDDDVLLGHDAYNASIILLTVLMAGGVFNGNIRPGTRGRTIRRVRRSVSSIMYELGSYSYSRRYYRMYNPSFWKLHGILKDKIDGPAGVSRRSRKKRKRSSSPNGPIHSSLRLSIAIRYFAGGDPLDIALVHGVSHSEVFFKGSLKIL